MSSIIGRLIAKDLYFYRWLIAGTPTVGIASLLVSHFVERDHVRGGANLGILLFITTVVAFGVFIPMFGIFKERQDKSQLFVLSLPVSTSHYVIAKISAALIAFLVPWLVLTATVVVVTVVSGGPLGGMPSFLAMMTFFLATFCMLTALIVMTTSEAWAIAGILITNVLVTIYFARIGNLPGIAAHTRDATATWSSTVLLVLAVEIALIVLSLVLAFSLASRRKDFV